MSLDERGPNGELLCPDGSLFYSRLDAQQDSAHFVFDKPRRSTTTTCNGRFARFYGSEGYWLPVTYHKRVNGRLRQLTVSPKLLRKVLR